MQLSLQKIPMNRRLVLLYWDDIPSLPVISPFPCPSYRVPLDHSRTMGWCFGSVSLRRTVLLCLGTAEVTNANARVRTFLCPKTHSKTDAGEVRPSACMVGGSNQVWRQPDCKLHPKAWASALLP